MFLLVLKACFLLAAEFLKGSELGAEEGRAKQTELWEWVGILAVSSWEPGCVAASPPSPRGVCAGVLPQPSTLMLSCQLGSKRILVCKKRDVFVLN